MNLTALSDPELLSHLNSLLGSQRELTAKLVATLAEVEERRLHLQAGYSSMFDFCTRRLKLREGEAYRRINAARLFKRYDNSQWALHLAGRGPYAALRAGGKGRMDAGARKVWR